MLFKRIIRHLETTYAGQYALEVWCLVILWSLVIFLPPPETRRWINFDASNEFPNHIATMNTGITHASALSSKRIVIMGGTAGLGLSAANQRSIAYMPGRLPGLE